MSDAGFADRFAARSAHLIRSWGGVLNSMHTRGDLNGRPLHLLAFQSFREIAFWSYCSNGMSEHLQGASRTELYIRTSKECPWAFEFLDALARYPFTSGKAVGDFDTWPLVQVPPEIPSSFKALLIAPPLEPPDTPVFDDAPLRIHRVVPVHASEFEFAIALGGAALWERLARSGEPLFMDVDRDRVFQGPPTPSMTGEFPTPEERVPVVAKTKVRVG